MKLKLALVAGGALFATPAFADDPAPTDAAATVEAGGGADANTGTTGAGMEGAAAVDANANAGAMPSMAWSRAVVERPYVLGKGKVAAYGQYAIAKFSFPNPLTGMSTSVTGDGFGVGGAYGVTDKITAGAQYEFTPGLVGDADSEIKGDLDLFGEFQIKHDGKLSLTASADFDLDLCGGSDAMGDCVTTKALHAGLGARYTLAPKMAVFTGAPYGPGPVGRHLKISLESDGPITFEVPVGFMFQVMPELNVHVMTALANISIANSDTVVFGADYIPLTLGGLYSVTPNIDVAAMFVLPDLKEIGFDLYAFSLGARWYN